MLGKTFYGRPPRVTFGVFGVTPKCPSVPSVPSVDCLLSAWIWLQGIFSELVRDKDAIFLTELEPNIEILDPGETRLVPDESPHFSVCGSK